MYILDKKVSSKICCCLLRPGSDVVLLPWRTQLQLGSTLARQKADFDSDVEPCDIESAVFILSVAEYSKTKRKLWLIKTETKNRKFFFFWKQGKCGYEFLSLLLSSFLQRRL